MQMYFPGDRISYVRALGSGKERRDNRKAQNPRVSVGDVVQVWDDLGPDRLVIRVRWRFATGPRDRYSIISTDDPWLGAN